VADAGTITRLLHEADAGDAGASDELMRVVYGELEAMAAGRLRRQFGAQAGQITLEPAALVNESFLRMAKQEIRYEDRRHFFGIATRIMLEVLIDYRRRKGALKRGGGDGPITFLIDEAPAVAKMNETAAAGIEVEQLRDALDELDRLDRRIADVVRMRIVWGLGNEEIAEVLEVSESTVKADWRFAKAWLGRRLGG